MTTLLQKLFNHPIKVNVFHQVKFGNIIHQQRLVVPFFLQARKFANKPANHKTVNEDITNTILPVERLREKALKVELKSSLRSRCRWTEEETQKLIQLVNVMGKRWSAISQKFIDRSPSNVMNHYLLLTEKYARGPWSEEELAALKELGAGRTFEEIDDWDQIQSRLPRLRPLFLVRQTYRHTLDPRLKHGRWSKEESDRLRELVGKYGEESMDYIASLMGSRTKRQCLERWRWQMADNRKGRFTPEEDKLILDAVEKYGENFAVICKVTDIGRTPRHVSQHYSTILNPAVDRSPWSEEEEALVYRTCKKNKRNMMKTRQELNSKRAIRDMWNHYRRHEKKIASEF